MGAQTDVLASAEGDDASDRIVRRHADGDAIPWNHLDSEAAHAAAQLGEDLMALVALHAVQTAAVDRYHSALHVNQIILAQLLSFPIKDCAIFQPGPQTRPFPLDTRTTTIGANAIPQLVVITAP
jgi:hypothetical protein